MPHTPMIISLPIADRRASFAFYRDGLGFDPIGEAAEDGVPEPLQFAINDSARIMLVPTGGFKYVIGGREVASPGQQECELNLGTTTPAAVDALVHRAREAGAAIVAEPTDQPWGYAGSFADPDGHVLMVTTVGDVR